MDRLALFMVCCVSALLIAGCNTGKGIQQEPFNATIRFEEDELPVFPGAEGFGTRTPAGRGGVLITVTTLAAEGPGSLREALAAPGPRTIVFEVGGVIDIRESLVITEPFATVAGQTAPEPGITIIGAGLVVTTHDVLIQHLRIRVGNRLDGPDPGGRDGIGVVGTPDGQREVCNVVIDHCSVSWAIDEGASTWHPGVRDVTFRQCIIAENLSRSIHPEREHSKGLLIGDHTRRIAVIGNLFAHNMRRSPLIKGDVSALLVNNFVYNPGSDIIHFSDPEDGGGSLAAIIGNVLLPGPDTRLKPMIHMLFSSKRTCRVYASDNLVAGARGWEFAVAQLKRGCAVDAAPVAIEGLEPLPGGEVQDWVLTCAGARPAFRDETDRRIVESVLTETGSIIDSQEEVGGFPHPPPASHTLELPPDPNADSDHDGYTDLEEWLDALAAAVEGRV